MILIKTIITYFWLKSKDLSQLSGMANNKLALTSGFVNINTTIL